MSLWWFLGARSESEMNLQVAVYTLQKISERGNLQSVTELSAEYQVVEVVCQVPSGNHLTGAEAIGMVCL